MYSGIYKERYIGFGGRILNNDVFFLSLDVSSSLEAPLALVLEDDVLDLRLVLENALARVLRLLHLHRLTGQF